MTIDTTARHADDAALATYTNRTMRDLITAERAKPKPDRTWLAAAEHAVAESDKLGRQANGALLRGLADGSVLDASRTSWGQRFTSSPQWRTRTGLTCAPVELGGYLEERAAAVPLVPGATGSGLGPVASLCGVIPAQPVNVTLLRWTGPLIPAEPQTPEELKASGGQAPVVTAVVAPTIASWIAATRQLLDDHAALSALIDGRLRLGLALALDNAIMETITADADIPPADSVLAAVGQLAAAGHVPGLVTVILSPDDYAVPGQAADFLALGVTVLASAGLRAGTAVVGSLAAGVQLRTIGAAQVLITDSHSRLHAQRADDPGRAAGRARRRRPVGTAARRRRRDRHQDGRQARRLGSLPVRRPRGPQPSAPSPGGRGHYGPSPRAHPTSVRTASGMRTRQLNRPLPCPYAPHTAHPWPCN